MPQITHLVSFVHFAKLDNTLHVQSFFVFAVDMCAYNYSNACLYC